MRTTVRIRSRDRWLALLAIVGFLTVCVAASAGRRTSGTPAPTQLQSAVQQQSTPQSSQPTDTKENPPPHRHRHLSLPLHLLDRLAIFASALGFIALIWLIVGVVPKLGRGRKRRPRAPPVAEEPADLPDEVAHEISRTLSTALAGVATGDANRAIVACWIRLEQIAEDAGYARQPSETSTELVTKWLGGSRLPPDALQELAESYREARYSDHLISSAAIDRARAALTQLRAAFVVSSGGERTDG